MGFIASSYSLTSLLRATPRTHIELRTPPKTNKAASQNSKHSATSNNINTHETRNRALRFK